MTLKRNSLYGKLYQWFYLSDLPKSLCPFFWKFILAVLFCIPVFILRIPSMIFDFYNKKSEKKKHDEYNIKYNENYKFYYYSPFGGFAIKILIGIAGYCIFILVLFWFAGLIQLISKGITPLSFNWIVINIIFLLRFLFFYFATKPKNIIKLKTPKFIEMTKESFKGFLNNYCPSITWE